MKSPVPARVRRALLLSALLALPLRAGSPAPGDGLMLLPENPRFFQYKGKPLLSVSHVTAGPNVPTRFSRERLQRAAQHGNHIYMAHPTWVLADLKKHHAGLNDDAYWAEVREIARWCHEHDVLLTFIFYSHKWNYGANAYGEPGCTDMLLSLDDPLLREDLGKYGLPGMTRLELQKLAIRKVVQATWDFPNVIYFHTWEMSHPILRQRKDVDGAFHRWWVDGFRAEGARQFPGRNLSHLFSIEFGAEPPSKLKGMVHPELKMAHPVAPAVRHADFIYAECSDGFAANPRQISNAVHALNVPLVRMSFSCGPRSGREGPQSPDDIRERLIYGVHPSGHFNNPIPREVEDYFLVARWYVENIRTWKDEVFSERGSAGDELIEGRIPRYHPSQRPALLPVVGFTDGVRIDGDTIMFACTYRHADGFEPAQAEVWVDRNGDGRFGTDPAAGERLEMRASGADFRGGVRYEARLHLSAAGQKALRYVFRFADRYWYPPLPGGLMLAPYSHFTVGPDISRARDGRAD
jgi:hypothetical protein